MRKTIDLFKKIQDKKELSLNEKTRWNNYLQEKKIIEEQKELYSGFTNKNIASAGRKKDKKKTDDLYLNECVNIMADYISLLKPTPKTKLANHISEQESVAGRQ